MSTPAVTVFESLWDATDVAKYLKVSRSWVYEKAEKEILPALHVGGLLRFDPAAIRQWLMGKPTLNVISLVRGA